MRLTKDERAIVDDARTLPDRVPGPWPVAVRLLAIIDRLCTPATEVPTEIVIAESNLRGLLDGHMLERDGVRVRLDPMAHAWARTLSAVPAMEARRFESVEYAEPIPSCPFCGGAPIMERTLRDGCADGEPDAWAYAARCLSCAATGGWGKSSASAARRWKMRVPATPAPNCGIDSADPDDCTLDVCARHGVARNPWRLVVPAKEAPAPGVADMMRIMGGEMEPTAATDVDQFTPARPGVVTGTITGHSHGKPEAITIALDEGQHARTVALANAGRVVVWPAGKVTT